MSRVAEIPTGHSANPQNLSRAVATHCLISGGLILVGMYISRNTEVMFKHTHIGAWRGATEIWGMNPAWARLTISTTDAIPSFILLRNKNYTVLPCPLIRASYVLLIGGRRHILNSALHYFVCCGPLWLFQSLSFNYSCTVFSCSNLII